MEFLSIPKITKIAHGLKCIWLKKRILASDKMKQALYNVLSYVGQAAIWPTQFFSKKMRLFVQGRTSVFNTLTNHLSHEDETIWFHCASLGEFEQGLPILNALKEKLPNAIIVLTFFSPSGYEIKKDTPLANVVTYLPIDTPSNAKRFVEIVKPTMVFFVKYEFWPNYLKELKKRNTPTFLVSGLFRKEQNFFKTNATFLRSALTTFQHFFVQDANSIKLLQQIGFDNVTESGDTRFDRVSHQIEIDNRLDFMESFVGNRLCLVCGSTWPEDEKVLLPFINSALERNMKVVVAPHQIEIDKIKSFQNQLTVSSITYSNHQKGDLENASVLIVDTIGLLSKIYSYASIAYVGGAMGSSGLHNILEPATFGVPIVIGKEYNKFPEALKLEDLAGLYSVHDAQTCSEILNKLADNEKFREQTGMICGHYINSNTGATRIIMEHLHRDGLI